MPARLKDDNVYRWILAHRSAFADPSAPTTTELNAAFDNDPNGVIFNVTCAVDQAGSQFDLDDPELDDSLTFCQVSGNSEVSSRSATVVIAMPMSAQRWDDASSTQAADGFNSSTLLQSLITWPGVEYIAILSVGETPDTQFKVGDRVKMAEVATDYATVDIGNGQNVGLVQNFAKRSFLNWNYELVA